MEMPILLLLELLCIQFSSLKSGLSGQILRFGCPLFAHFLDVHEITASPMAPTYISPLQSGRTEASLHALYWQSIAAQLSSPSDGGTAL